VYRYGLATSNNATAILANHNCDADIFLAGGSEACVVEIGLAGFSA